MKHFAIIENQVAMNIAIATSPLADNWVDLTDMTPEPGVGWGYVEGAFAPPPPLPEVESSRALTHVGFRRLFTPIEQELADELEVLFEGRPDLTLAQKRTLRTGYKNFYAASTVDLDDPDIPPMLWLYVTLGILEATRPAEILA